MRKKTPMSQYINAKLEDLPNNPPTSFDDLKPERRLEKVVFELPDAHSDIPEVLDLWKTMVEAARSMPSLRVNGGEILAKNTPLIIEKKIEQAQEEYDLHRKRFHSLVNGNATGTKYFFNYDSYLDLEGIMWDAALTEELTGENND